MNKPMKINMLLLMRSLQSVFAATSLAALAGCAAHPEHPHAVRSAPAGDPVDNALVPDPNNSGPHQFPLSITTKRNFYPQSAQVVASDKTHVTIIVTGAPGKADGKEMMNSGPHQGN